MLKRLSKIRVSLILLLALVNSNHVLAAEYAEDCPCDLYLNQFDGGIRVSAEFLYFTANIDNSNTALTTFVDANGIEQFKSHTIEMGYNPGFVIDIGYQFPGTAYEANFRYTSVVVEGSDKTYGPNTIALFSNQNGIAQAPDLILINPIAQATGRARVDLTNIEFFFGQTVKTATDRVRLKWKIGGRSSSLHVKSKALYAQDEEGEIGESVVATSDFSGFGPVIGAEGMLRLGYGFSLTSEILGAFMVGKVGAHVEDQFINTAALDANDNPITVKGNSSFDYEDLLITSIDARLGLRYETVFRKEHQLDFEAGWQFSNYFDVDYRFSESGNDVGFSGLYLRVSYYM